MADKEVNLKELAESFGNQNLDPHEAAAKVVKYFVHVRLTMAV